MKGLLLFVWCMLYVLASHAQEHTPINETEMSMMLDQRYSVDSPYGLFEWYKMIFRTALLFPDDRTRHSCLRPTPIGPWSMDLAEKQECSSYSSWRADTITWIIFKDYRFHLINLIILFVLTIGIIGITKLTDRIDQTMIAWDQRMVIDPSEKFTFTFQQTVLHWIRLTIWITIWILIVFCILIPCIIRTAIFCLFWMIIPFFTVVCLAPFNFIFHHMWASLFVLALTLWGVSYLSNRLDKSIKPRQ